MKKSPKQQIYEILRLLCGMFSLMAFAICVICSATCSDYASEKGAMIYLSLFATTILLILTLVFTKMLEDEKKAEAAIAEAQKQILGAKYVEKINNKTNEIRKLINVDKLMVFKDRRYQFVWAKESIVVGVDIKNEQMAVYCDKINIIDLKDVYNVEALTQTSSVGRSMSTSNDAMGRAMVGGLIGGATGAIIGAASADVQTISTSTIRNDYIGLKIYSRSIVNPCYEIYCDDSAFVQNLYNTLMAYLQTKN